MIPSPLRLRFAGDALTANWNALNKLSGAAACGAAVKANAYGIGVTEVVPRLIKAGCRDFFVATWQEAAQIADLTAGSSVSVLNGLLADDIHVALKFGAKPMINSLEQAQRWKGTGRPCDVMINSGMNRLGIDCRDVITFDWQGLDIDILASHLASADEDVAQNSEQLSAFRAIFDHVPHRRKSMANSAGIALGADYALQLTRPGLALYGGIQRSELAEVISSIGSIEARILQVRRLEAGEKVGYNATFTAKEQMTIGISALGYADGYLRGFSGRGELFNEGRSLPVLGRISMDLVAVDLSSASNLGEGDWLECPLDLPKLARQSGLSQYEIITGLGPRSLRIWDS
ncbi:MAG: alanine racemase [Pontixanthobacter sp.]